jgi:hypothetical protein
MWLAVPAQILYAAVEERDSLDGSARPSLAIRDAPGAGLVMWAESAAGVLELERPYARSATLDGEPLGSVVLGVHPRTAYQRTPVHYTESSAFEQFSADPCVQPYLRHPVCSAVSI